VIAVVQPSSTDHDPLVRAVAAHGLAGTMLDLPDQPLDDPRFLRLHQRVRAQRISGLLWATVLDGSLPVSTAQAERAEEGHVQLLGATLVLEDLLLQTVAAWQAEGVPYRALKGPALAHLDYPDPGHRVFGDIDLLVPSTHYDRAVAVLVARGCARRYPEPRPGFDRRFGKGACLVTEDGLEIDVHRSFTMGPYGERLAVDLLWEHPTPFPLAGTTIEALSPEGRFLHAAYHIVLGDRRPRLSPMRDLAQIALGGTVDWPRLRALMSASEGEAVVARAVRTTWQQLAIADVLAISAWAESYREGERESAALALYGARSTYAARSFGTVRAIRAWRDRARYVAALVLPEQAYLAERHRGHRERLRTGFTQIMRGSS